MPPLQSIILISPDPEAYLSRHHQLDPHSDHPDIYRIKPEKSTGIEAVRQAISYAARPPLSGPTKYLIFYQGDSLTPAAQNALLKILEEPPAYLAIFITAARLSSFIDTVISRCQVVYEQPDLIPADSNTGLLAELRALPPCQRLRLIPGSSKAAADAGTWIAGLLVMARYQHRQQPTAATLQNLSLISDCRHALEKNANPTIIVADTLLQLL
jgi:hypothetical protein